MMQSLTLELSNRRVVYDRGVGYSERRVLFDASLDAADRVQVSSGAMLDRGEVGFSLGTCSRPLASLGYQAGDRQGVDVFSLDATLESAAFEHLIHLDPAAHEICLTFSAAPWETGLSCARATHDCTLYWDLAKANPLTAHSLTLSILHRKPLLDVLPPLPAASLASQEGRDQSVAWRLATCTLLLACCVLMFMRAL